MSTVGSLYARQLRADNARHRLSLGRMSLVAAFCLSLASGPAAALVDDPRGVLIEDVKATAIIRSCAEEPKFLGVATLREAASKGASRRLAL